MDLSEDTHQSPEKSAVCYVYICHKCTCGDIGNIVYNNEVSASDIQPGGVHLTNSSGDESPGRGPLNVTPGDLNEHDNSINDRESHTEEGTETETEMKDNDDNDEKQNEKCNEREYISPAYSAEPYLQPEYEEEPESAEDRGSDEVRAES